MNDDAKDARQAVLLAEGRRFFSKPWVFVIGVPSLKFCHPKGRLK